MFVYHLELFLVLLPKNKQTHLDKYLTAIVKIISLENTNNIIIFFFNFFFRNIIYQNKIKLYSQKVTEHIRE